MSMAANPDSSMNLGKRFKDDKDYVGMIMWELGFVKVFGEQCLEREVRVFLQKSCFPFDVRNHHLPK